MCKYCKLLHIYFVFIFFFMQALIIFSEIYSRKLSLQDYKHGIDSTDKKKLWTVLECSNGSEMAGWKKFGIYWCSEKGGKVLLEEEVEYLNKCCYKLGCKIVENMKTKGVTVEDLERVVMSKCRGRNDLLQCLAELKKIKNGDGLNNYNEVDLENLKMRLTDKNHESDWETIFFEVCRTTGHEQKNVSLTIDEFKNFQQNQVVSSPCKVLFEMLYTRNPDLSLLHIYKALTASKLKSASKCFIENIATLLHYKMRKEGD